MRNRRFYAAVLLLFSAFFLFDIVAPVDAAGPLLGLIIPVADFFVGTNMGAGLLFSLGLHAAAIGGLFYWAFDRTNGGTKAQPPGEEVVWVDLTEFSQKQKAKADAVKSEYVSSHPDLPNYGSTEYTNGANVSYGDYGTGTGWYLYCFWPGYCCTNGPDGVIMQGYLTKTPISSSAGWSACSSSQSESGSRDYVDDAAQPSVEEAFNNDSLRPYEFGNGSIADDLAQDVGSSPIGLSAGPSGPGGTSSNTFATPVDGQNTKEYSTAGDAKTGLELGQGGNAVAPGAGAGSGLTQDAVKEAVKDAEKENDEEKSAPPVGDGTGQYRGRENHFSDWFPQLWQQAQQAPIVAFASKLAYPAGGACDWGENISLTHGSVSLGIGSVFSVSGLIAVIRFVIVAGAFVSSYFIILGGRK